MAPMPIYLPPPYQVFWAMVLYYIIQIRRSEGDVPSIATFLMHVQNGHKYINLKIIVKLLVIGRCQVSGGG